MKNLYIIAIVVGIALFCVLVLFSRTPDTETLDVDRCLATMDSYEKLLDEHQNLLDGYKDLRLENGRLNTELNRAMTPVPLPYQDKG